jgi:3-isopropylmalate/(R)-2-methylmalate dehydratase large subunit
MSSTIAEKILARHAGLDHVKPGDIVVAKVDFAMVHDARAPNAIRMVDKMGAARLPFAGKTAWVLDHYSPPPNVEAAQGHSAMRRFAGEHGSVLQDIGNGICHQVLPEGGHLTCGDLIVGTDTHSVTYGAFNAFGTGIEGTDVSAVLATGKVWLRVPESMRVQLDGRLQPGVWAKDLTLYMLGRFGAQGLNYRAIEYVGSTVSAMEIDDRMTLANHAAELGPRPPCWSATAKRWPGWQRMAPNRPSPCRPMAMRITRSG